MALAPVAELRLTMTELEVVRAALLSMRATNDSSFLPPDMKRDGKGVEVNLTELVEHVNAAIEYGAIMEANQAMREPNS